MADLMAHAQVEDRFYDHPKVLELLDQEDGLAAIGLWTLALAWSHDNTRQNGWEWAGRLPRRQLRRLLLTQADHLAALLVKARLWEVTDEGWLFHDFDEHQQLAAWRAKSEGGRRSGAVRRARTPSSQASLEEGSEEYANTLANQEHKQEQPTGTTTSKTSPPAAAVDAMFEEFYRAYPRHVAPGAARKAYNNALKRATPETILAGALRYRDDPNRSDEFTKHPSTWLNQDCWGDDPLPARGGQSRDDGGTGTGTYAPYKPF